MTTLQFIDRLHSDSQKWNLYAKSNIIPAWVADADYKCAEPILSALHDRLQHGVFGYAVPPAGLAETIISYFYRRWNWQVSADWLLYSPGLVCAIHNVHRIVADEGNADVLTPQPIYHAFRRANAPAGCRRLDVPMQYSGTTWTLSVDDLEAMRTPQTRLLNLCNPHNPNGKVYSRDELMAIGEFCLRHDLLICSDEVHADIILETGRQHIPIASLAPEIAERTITMQSPSKAFNIPGLNFAVIVIPNASLRRRYADAIAGMGFLHLNVNSVGCTAAQAAWSGACDDWLITAIDMLRQRHDRLYEAVGKIEGISMTPLQATYLAWLNVAALNLSDAPSHFERYGIGMSAGATFGDADYMRLNFACSDTTLEAMIAALTAAAQQ